MGKRPWSKDDGNHSIEGAGEGDTKSFLFYLATQLTKEEYDMCKYFVFLVVTVPVCGLSPMPSFVSTDIAPLTWVDPIGIVVFFVINQYK